MSHKSDESSEDEFQPVDQHKKERLASKSFHNSISELINHIGRHHSMRFSLQAVCDEYKFEKRRFYDVVNVFEAIGCCKKIDANHMLWYGIINVKKHIKRLLKKHISAPLDTPIEELFMIDKTLSISSLTNSYMFSFITLQTRELNIRDLSLFLSKYNGRYKSTLCKMYQITHILRAMGILEQNRTQGISIIREEYYSSMQIPTSNQVVHPFSIQSLLNDEEHEQNIPNVLDYRRKLYHDSVVA